MFHLYHFFFLFNERKKSLKKSGPFFQKKKFGKMKKKRDDPELSQVPCSALPQKYQPFLSGQNVHMEMPSFVSKHPEIAAGVIAIRPLVEMMCSSIAATKKLYREHRDGGVRPLKLELEARFGRLYTPPATFSKNNTKEKFFPGVPPEFHNAITELLARGEDWVIEDEDWVEIHDFFFKLEGNMTARSSVSFHYCPPHLMEKHRPAEASVSDNSAESSGTKVSKRQKKYQQQLQQKSNVAVILGTTDTSGDMYLFEENQNEKQTPSLEKDEKNDTEEPVSRPRDPPLLEIEKTVRNMIESKIKDHGQHVIHIETIIKDKKGSVDLRALGPVAESVPDVRVSFSHEIDLKPSEIPAVVNPTFVRIKQRRSFRYKTWRYDLTRTWDANSLAEASQKQARGDPPVYEVELELVDPESYIASDPDISPVYIATSMLLKLLDLVRVINQVSEYQAPEKPPRKKRSKNSDNPFLDDFYALQKAVTSSSDEEEEVSDRKRNCPFRWIAASVPFKK
jgi:hypothetical protein